MDHWDRETQQQPPFAPTDAQRHYVEELAVVLEGMGLVRMHGRVVGWLLICDPPEQSASDIQLALEASKGSISGALRFLTTAELVEQAPKPGKRRNYYRIRRHAWSRMISKRVPLFATFAELAERGLREFDDPSGRLERLHEMRDFFRWLEREMPELLESWTRWSGKETLEE
ncbi:GbsR/MarR family transcriptional regulator [Salinactinospora qingdaonensis]|uniref:MarR family transcriptional regulator n=1 Tax=Salinactinospora qingdaonensis TaxID=702744 RepID=A0ABP7FWH6_9ACTN